MCYHNTYFWHIKHTSILQYTLNLKVKIYSDILRHPSDGRLPPHHLLEPEREDGRAGQGEGGVLQQLDLRGDVHQRGGHDGRREGAGE